MYNSLSRRAVSPRAVIRAYVRSLPTPRVEHLSGNSEKFHSYVSRRVIVSRDTQSVAEFLSPLALTISICETSRLNNDVISALFAPS